MHLNQHIFRSRSLQKYLNHEAHVFSEDWKLNVDFKVAKEIQEKIYGFLDSLIWIGNAKFSLLLPEYS